MKRLYIIVFVLILMLCLFIIFSFGRKVEVDNDNFSDVNNELTYVSSLQSSLSESEEIVVDEIPYQHLILVKNEEGNKCPICFKDETGGLNVLFRCGHFVCNECIDDLRSLSCPMCRASIANDLPDHLLRKIRNNINEDLEARSAREAREIRRLRLFLIARDMSLGNPVDPLEDIEGVTSSSEGDDFEINQPQ